MASSNTERVVSPSELAKGLHCEAGHAHVIAIRRMLARWLEMPDLLFHHDSVVVMPETESDDELLADVDHRPGLSVIRAAYLQARDHPAQKLLIAGHSDTSGRSGYNEHLSKLRAASVLHLLVGDRDAWVAIADAHHREEDIKHILRWVSRWKGWPCHTDSSRGTIDARTNRAIRAFQSEYRKFGQSAIAIDGELGKQTWGAIFQMYMEYLAELCETDLAGLHVLRRHVTWLYSANKSIGCGEYHPVDRPGEDAFKSQENRRVDLLFFEPGEEPLKDPSVGLCHKGGVAGARDCPLYNPRIYHYECVARKPATRREAKVVEVVAQSSFRLCKPGGFKVSKYIGAPTATEKASIQWFIRDAVTKDDLLSPNKSAITADGEQLTIDCVPIDWHDRAIEIGAQFGAPPKDMMFSGKPASVGVYDWIVMIRKAEAAYPAWSGVQMTNALRRVVPPGISGPAPGAPYDTAFFQMLYGGSPPGQTLLPSGSLMRPDIDQLGLWAWHRMVGGVEVGVVDGPDGDQLAPAHVLTGLSAGVYRNRRIDVTPFYSLAAGEQMDNLYAATIAGDLGQVAVRVNAGKQQKPYIGSHGDATDAELIGDIDGWLIGYNEPRGGSGKKLSEILLEYYCPCARSGMSYRNRFTTFQKIGLALLEDEVIRFASTYVYGSEGVRSGAFSEISTESREAYAEFTEWLGAKAVEGR